MRSGPLRRLVGAFGLVALVPTAVLLLQGGLSPGVAALRALATLGVAVLLGRGVGWWLSATARGFERRGRATSSHDAGGSGSQATDRGRRRTDAVTQTIRQGP